MPEKYIPPYLRKKLEEEKLEQERIKKEQERIKKEYSFDKIELINLTC